MKRKDLKAGEWYRIPSIHTDIFLANGHYVVSNGSRYFPDFRERGPREGMSNELIGGGVKVTPCAPPEWFSEVWERREG